MILLDQLGELSEEGLYTYVHISPKSAFFEDDAVPAYVGLEYMAQTVAAYAGYRAINSQGKVKEGFLLGSREVTFHKTSFDEGETLKVSCREFMSNDEMGVFSCAIYSNSTNDLYCECKLNVFQPENPEAFFSEYV